MAGKIKIGFLTPYSGVYPYYGQHIMAGMLLGIYPGVVKNDEIEFIPEYTKMGDPRSTLEATNKLIFFNQVDVVSGLLSYKSLPDIIPVIEKNNKLGFFFDMGEYIPYFNHLSERVFFSSQQIYQSEYALGNWAHREFGEGGMTVMSIYESGYNISGTFYKGAKDAGMEALTTHVIPHERLDSKQLDLTGFYEAIAKNKPTYVHAIFIGDMGNEFLASWKNSGYHKQIPLIVVENMAYDDVLQDVGSLDLDLIAAATWSRSAEDKRNTEFVKRYESTGGQMANIFGLMGYEAGLALREVKTLLLKGDKDAVATLLQKETITGPRGDRNFYPASGFALPVIDIQSVKTSINNIYKTVISQGKGLRFDSEAFKAIHEEGISGWLNPYLCI
jgi:branched-chain amino acid transport system substrate-binding protein